MTTLSMFHPPINTKLNSPFKRSRETCTDTSKKEFHSYFQGTSTRLPPKSWSLPSRETSRQWSLSTWPHADHSETANSSTRTWTRCTTTGTVWNSTTLNWPGQTSATTYKSKLTSRSLLLSDSRTKEIQKKTATQTTHATTQENLREFNCGTLYQDASSRSKLLYK